MQKTFNPHENKKKVEQLSIEKLNEIIAIQRAKIAALEAKISGMLKRI